MHRIILISLFSLLFTSGALYAQKRQVDSTIIQFSGQVIMDEDGELVSLPFVNVFIKDQTHRGDYTDENGFFSIVARKGETVVFSGIGLKTVEFEIPDSLDRQRYSIVQLMTTDIYNLPETLIFPWPSREHFKIEFLAMDVSNELESRARENLSSESMEELQERLPADGLETSKVYFKQQAEADYARGQFKPMNIMSPLAWAKFFKAWKDGDFKSDKKKKKE